MIRSNPTASLPNGSPDRGRQVLGIVLQNDPTLMQEAYDAFFKTAKGSAKEIQAAAKLDLFLKQGGSANQLTGDGRTPATKAIAQDRPWLFRRLFNASNFQPDTLNQGKCPAIHTAILKGNREAFEKLVKRNNPIQPETLQLAVDCGQPEMLTTLLAHKATVSLSTEDIAVLQDLALLKQKAIQTLRQFPQSVLQDKLGQVSSVLETYLLLQAGADVNGSNSHGDTPLHLAASRNYLEIAQLLIAEGGNVNAPNYANRTPLDFALRTGGDELIQLFRQAGAQSNSPSRWMPIRLLREDSWG